MRKLRLGQVKTAAIISYLALALNIILGFLYTPWMVDKIGDANYGLYTLATSVITIFMLDFGLGSAVSRFVSKYRAEKNQKAIDDIMSAIYKLYIAIDIAIFVVLTVIFFFLDIIYVKLDPQELEKFKTLYLIVAFFNVISFPFTPLDGVLNAYEKLAQLKLCSLFNKVFTVIAVVLTLYFTNDVAAVVGANIAVGLLTIILKLVIVKSNTPLKINLRFKGKETYKTLFSFTAWTTIINLMQRFTHTLSPSVLAMTSGALEIAVYSPAVIIEGYYYTLATAIQGLFLPRISRFIAEKKENEILNLAIKLGRYQVITLGLIFIGFVCVGYDFMILWMGPEYAKTYYCTLILIFPTLISSSQQIASTTVIAKNLVKYQALCMLMTGTVGLGVSYISSKFIGAIGVCIGTAVAALANTVFMNFVYIKKAGLDMFKFYKQVYLRAVPAYILSAVISWFSVSFINILGWKGLIIKGIVISLIYFVAVFLFCINSDEKKKIAGLLKKVLRRDGN